MATILIQIVSFNARKNLSEKFPYWEIYIIFVNKKTVRIIAKSTLREFWIKHKDCEEQFKSWYDEAEKSNWFSPNEIKQDYPSASILQDNRVVFNIKGNSYRLIVKINYKFGIVWIRFIGTHGEYDKVNAVTI
jgi:mRNA interferase HigB